MPFAALGAVSGAENLDSSLPAPKSLDFVFGNGSSNPRAFTVYQELCQVHCLHHLIFSYYPENRYYFPVYMREMMLAELELKFKPNLADFHVPSVTLCHLL